MAKHATIGNSQVGRKNTTLKQANRNRSSQPVQRGVDVNLPGDRRGTLGMSTPVTAPYDIASPALGKTFESKLAQSIVPQGTWRQVDGGYMIRTQVGYLRLIKGMVLLNTTKLGYCGNIVSQKSRDEVLTHVIAGTLPQSPIRSEKSKVERMAKAYVGGLIEFEVCQVTLEPVRACDHCH